MSKLFYVTLVMLYPYHLIQYRFNAVDITPSKDDDCLCWAFFFFMILCYFRLSPSLGPLKGDLNPVWWLFE